MIDKKKRTIDILYYEDDEITVKAYDNGIFAGEFVFTKEEGDIVKLHYMNMEEEYLSCGIGTEMLKEALQRISSFILPKPKSQASAGDGDWLSEEAEAFFQSCVSKGFCKNNNRVIML